MKTKKEEFNYFDELTYSLATSRKLLQKAHDGGSLIEGLCLYVSIIDGFLRLAIIYSRTQKSPKHTYDVEKQMIRQDEKERTYSEKEIYGMAFKEDIISSDIYQKLNQMYLFRNKVVHRFNISDIKYNQIAEACIKFELIYQDIFDILSILEHGSLKIPKLKKKDEARVHKEIFKKIGYKNH